MFRNKHHLQLAVCISLLILNLLFIWGNSLMPGEQSSELSGGLMEWVVEIVGEEIPNGEFLLRKLAHFSEFASLGLLLTWLSLLLSQSGIHRVTMPLLGGMTAALVDETIQVLTPERGPSVVDVWIDTAGAAAGILILLIGYTLLEGRKHHTIGGNKS